MSKTQKRDATFAAGGNVPAGTIMHLDFAQADARRHLLKPVKGWHKSREDKGRKPFVSDRSVYFKAGEQLVLEHEGALDRGLEMAISAPTSASPDKADEGRVPSAAAIEKARADGHKAGRAEMLAEVVKRNELIEAEETAADELAAAEDALAAGAEADKPALQAAVDAAKTALETAQAAVAALPAIGA